MGYARPVNANYTGRWGYYPSGRTHKALDFPVPTGTRVQNGMAGTVTVAGWSSTGFGYQVRVRYDDGNTAIYAHLSRISVKVGQRVAKRATLGYSGNTGNSTGPHLHWEVRKFSWVPLSSWNFTALIESYSARSVTTTTTTTTAPKLAYTGYSFNRRLLKVGANNSEVEKFQWWLWQRQPPAFRTWMAANVYDFNKYLPTTKYGPATAKMVQETYARLHRANPTAGWDTGVVNGVWPSEPGPALFKYFGNTSYYK